KKKGVKVADLLDGKSCIAHERFQTLCVIPPKMMTDDVLPSPKKLEGGDGHKKPALWLQYAVQLASSQSVILQVLNDVEGHRCVEPAAAKRQSHPVRAHEIIQLLGCA